MIRTMLRAALAAVVVGLAACGGGSNTCQEVTGGTACAGNGGGDATSTVSRLSLTLSAATIANTGSETVAVTVVAANASNQTVAGAPVLMSVIDTGAAGDAEVTVDGSETDENGQLTARVRLGENRNNRPITVRATAEDGSVVATRTFQVIGAELTGTPVPKTIEPGAAGLVTFWLVDANDNPMANAAITVTGVSGAETGGTTSSSGEYSYSYTAPSTTGESTIRASAGGVETAVTVLVQTLGSGGVPVVDEAAFPIRSASVVANPSVVSVNTIGSTSNFAQLRALFVTNNNEPVENIRVRFEIDGTNSPGGSISTGSSLVYSDAGGVATSTYVAGLTQSPTDGVTIKACWSYTDTVVCDPAHTVTTKLTVVSDPVSVSIGTNATITNGESGLTYVKRYVVQVVDSSGVAKSGVTISPSLDLLRYYKGVWVPGVDTWVQVISADGSCDNEDLNRNNVYEVYADGWDEDANGSLNLTPGRPALEPRKADVAVSFEGSAQTDASGIVVLRLEYPQDIGSWVEFNLQVSASGVSGTEGRANFSARLPVAAAAVSNLNADPPFRTSPYGTGVGNTTTKVYEGVTYTLCRNPN